MNKEVKKYCKADNQLQRKLLKGEITEAEFRFKIENSKIHKDYIIASGEEKLLKELLKKHGGC